jgi:hypothetical protein
MRDNKILVVGLFKGTAARKRGKVKNIEMSHLNMNII